MAYTSKNEPIFENFVLDIVIPNYGSFFLNIFWKFRPEFVDKGKKGP